MVQASAAIMEFGVHSTPPRAICKISAVQRGLWTVLVKCCSKADWLANPLGWNIYGYSECL